MRRSLALALVLVAGCAPRKKMEVYTPPPLTPAPAAAPTETAAAPTATPPPALPSPDIVLGPALTPHGLVFPPGWGMPTLPAGAPAGFPSALPFPMPSAFPFPTGTAAPVPTTAPPPAPTPSSWSPASAAMEDKVLALVNQHRAMGAICGTKTFGPAPPLGPDPMAALQKAARGHSQDMATKNYFSHDAPDGRRPQDRMKAAGFFGGYSGENIAAGNETAEATVGQWMKSPGHCENIMDKDFKYLGVGYFGNPAAQYKHYWTQNFGG